MEEEPRFQQILEEIEAKKRSTLFPDGLGIGPIVFGSIFLLLVVLAFAAFTGKHLANEKFYILCFGLGSLLSSIHLFRNAVRRAPKHLKR
jgi:hypothetical protein